MPLNDEQKEKLSAWLHSKGCNPDCPSCGHNEWSFGDIVAFPHVSVEGIDENAFVPAVQLICKNCAYVRSHAAIPIGLLFTGITVEESPTEQGE